MSKSTPSKHEYKAKFEEKKPDFEKKHPKFEEFRKETRGKPGSSGPFSEDTYYAMRDESDVATDSGRTQKKVEFESKTHVEVMSDKKIEVFESSSVDVSPPSHKKPAFKQEQKIERKVPSKPQVEKQKELTKSFPSTKQTTQETRTEKKVVSEVTEKKEHAAKTVSYKKTVETTKVDGKEIKKPRQPVEPKQKMIKQQEKFVKEPVIKAQPKVPTVEPLKSTGLVKKAVIQQDLKEELDLKPFPFQAEPIRPKKPKGAPPPQPSKFQKSDFHLSDYDSDFEVRIPPKWKPADSDAEEQSYGTVSAPAGKQKDTQPHIRTPTPPTAFDSPPQFEGPPRPKIEFPESEPEPERGATHEIVLPERIKVIKEPEPPKIVPKEGKVFKSQPKKPKPSPDRPPSPKLKPGSPPVEDYAPPPPKPKPTHSSPFSNAVGVESTKITKIADTSTTHKRFVTMQQTTRVIKFSDGHSSTLVTETQSTPQAPEFREKKISKESQKPLPPLEPFPFTPDPEKPKKDRGGPPSKPKKFKKGEFTESDYESDYEGPLRPKWQPTDSDTEDLTYRKIKPVIPSAKAQPLPKERTPTPPTIFDTPPESGGPWRPVIKTQDLVVQRDPSPIVVVATEPSKKVDFAKKVTEKIEQKTVKQVERPPSPELPPPGTPPEEGIITEEVQYVVDKVDVQSRVKGPPMQVVQTYEDKPYTKVTERTEKKYTNIKLEEEIKMKKDKKEIKKTIVTEYEQIPIPQPSYVKQEPAPSEEKILDLKPFPYEPGKEKPKRERGPPPPKPKKFVKGEFHESDYDSDFEHRLRPKWQPPDSDAEDPEYTSVKPPPPSGREISRSKERTPTPPSKFDVPTPTGGPLRPTIDVIEKHKPIAKETTPEIVIPKVKLHQVTKSPKITPKAPVLKAPEPKAPPPRAPTPPLPEPGPQPEIGYAPARVVQKEEEDVYIKMIKKKVDTKKGIQIDIDVTNIYDLVSESDQEKTERESEKLVKPFPTLEPFPYEPDPSRPKRQRGLPPPQPKKFMKGEFKDDAYESDYDAPIAPKWVPPDSEGEEHAYRRVAPPALEVTKQRSESSCKEPSPPSKFDQPPQFEGPPRPVLEPSDLPRRERRESLEEYSIPRFPKVEFKPFDLEDDQVAGSHAAITTDTETEPESCMQSGIDKKYVKSAQKVVSHQFDDMSQTFRHKAQKFAEQLVTEVFAAREGSVPTETAGEPPIVPEELKTQEQPTESATQGALSPSTQEPQVYRDESRISEFGTKHLDPDTGLIYFKYDFGYEFGVVLPGEAKKVDKKIEMNGDHSSDIPIPVLHEKSAVTKDSEKKSSKSNGHVHHLEASHPEAPAPAQGPTSNLTSGTEHISPQPSQQSDISETDREYQQYMGKMIPEFVPKKQAQFRPISGDPYSDSEIDSDRPSPSKLSDPSSSGHIGPKRFIPVVPGATVHPKTPSTPAELGATARSVSGKRGDPEARVCGAGRPPSSGHLVTGGRHPPQ